MTEGFEKDVTYFCQNICCKCRTHGEDQMQIELLPYHHFFFQSLAQAGRQLPLSVLLLLLLLLLPLPLT